jgi:hypothetical protein
MNLTIYCWLGSSHVISCKPQEQATMNASEFTVDVFQNEYLDTRAREVNAIVTVTSAGSATNQARGHGKRRRLRGDDEASMAKEMDDIALRVWTPQSATVRFLKQVAPTAPGRVFGWGRSWTCWPRPVTLPRLVPGWRQMLTSASPPRRRPRGLITVHDAPPASRAAVGVRRERLASLPEEGAVARRSGAALAARSWRRAEVQRSVHAGVSLQYQRMSPQALPPSGTIRLCCRRIPHIQHETTAGRRAAKPPAEGARSSSAMTGSPPGDRRDPGLRLEDEQRPARSRSWLDNRWLAC